MRYRVTGEDLTASLSNSDTVGRLALPMRLLYLPPANRQLCTIGVRGGTLPALDIGRGRQGGHPARSFGIGRRAAQRAAGRYRAVECPAVRLILGILSRTVLAVLLLIAVVVVVLRVRDRGGRMDRFEYAEAGGRAVWVHSGGGWLSVVAARPWPESRVARWVSVTRDDPIRNVYGIDIIQREQLWGDRWGVEFERGRAYSIVGPDVRAWGPQVRFLIVYVPHWIAATACALPPLAWFALVVPKRIRQRRRKRRGLCPACGYDLRATPERCPECGLSPKHRRELSVVP
jgi:hypothetical protein